MRKFIILPLAAACALAACGDSDVEETGTGEGADGTEMAGSPDEPMSDEQIATAMDQVPLPQAGEYRTTQELLEFSIPGVSPEMQAMARSAMSEGFAVENTYCLTADEANPRERMLEGMAENDCNLQRFDVSGGTIDGLLMCPGDGGIDGQLAMTGTMSENGSDMVMTFEANSGSDTAAQIRMRVVSERIGECS